MLIHCPQCNAGYEFPPEQLPPDGLRAKCARCAFVMLILADKGAIDPSTGLGQVLFKPRPGGSEVTHQVKQTAERQVDSGPNVVIDMGQLADTPAPAKSEAELPPPIDLAAFAPLAATPALPASQKTKPRSAAAFAPAEPIDPSEIREVRPLGMASAVMIGLLLLAGLFVLFVAARNDWAPQWDDPVAAVKHAFEVRESARAKREHAPAVVAVEVEAIKGKLEIKDLQAKTYKQFTLVQGTLLNASNRGQHGVGLEITLSKGPHKPPLKARTVFCCDRFTAKEASAIAKNPKHPHFSDKFNPSTAVALKPKESRPFSVVFRAPPKGATHAEGRVKFSEVEAAGATP